MHTRPMHIYFLLQTGVFPPDGVNASPTNRMLWHAAQRPQHSNRRMPCGLTVDVMMWPLASGASFRVQVPKKALDKLRVYL